jgi:hypothetical protein
LAGGNAIYPGGNIPGSEAEFLDVVGTKFIRFFLLAIHRHLPLLKYFIPLSPPPPRSQSGLKLVCNVNIVYENLKSEKSQDYAQAETSTKFYIHEFGFCSSYC